MDHGVSRGTQGLAFLSLQNPNGLSDRNMTQGSRATVAGEPQGGHADASPRHCAPPRDWRRGFWSLILTQFQTGFSDNGLKFLVIYMVIEMNLPNAERDRLVPIVNAAFAIPFILFSMAGGNLADRFSKRSVTIATKLFEFAIMGFFILSLALRN